MTDPEVSPELRRWLQSPLFASGLPDPASDSAHTAAWHHIAAADGCAADEPDVSGSSEAGSDEPGADSERRFVAALVDGVGGAGALNARMVDMASSTSAAVSALLL